MVEENVVNKVKLMTFYSQTSNEKEIIDKNGNSQERFANVGPKLQEVLNVMKYGLSLRKVDYSIDGQWSGDLYCVTKRVFTYQNETTLFMGDSGRGGEIIGNVYELIMSSTNGNTQYISVVLEGEVPERYNIETELNNMDFAPKNSYLAKDDRALLKNCLGNNKLWIEKIISRP